MPTEIAMFFVSLLASITGSLIGGTSLITIPTLIMLSVPAHTAIGTDRFAIFGGVLEGLYKFHKKGWINYRVGITVGIPVLIGSALGARLALEFSEDLLKLAIIFMNLLVLGLFVIRPQLGLERRKRTEGLGCGVFGAVVCLALGAYGGFYGAMVGTLTVYVFILWYGLTFLECAGTIKLSALGLNLSAAVMYACNGAVDYRLGLIMLAGCMIGNLIGAHYADRLGNKWIRRILILFVLTAVVKIALNL
ncbi:MAG: sulfite exporter TauE/SafE family protein [Deltaproteobacteria bacterium]|nr:sulfite exporter TauE/SafE family protein [Deltaproteobacteria bacterium]